MGMRGTHRWTRMGVGGLLLWAASGAYMPLAAQKFNSVTPDPVTLTTPTTADFNAGWTQTASLALGMTGQGKTYQLDVSRSEPFAQPLEGQVYFRVSGDVSWTVLGSGPVTVLSGGSGNVTLTLELRKTLVRADDLPGTYSSAIKLDLYSVTGGTPTLSETRDTEVTMTAVSVPPTLSVSAGSVALPPPTSANFGGHSATGDIAFTISEGDPWELYWQLQEPYATPIAGTPDWQVAGSGAWSGTFASPGTWYLVASGSAGGTHTRDLRTDLDWARDVPAGYASRVDVELRATSAAGGAVFETGSFDLTMVVNQTLSIALTGTTDIDFGAATAGGVRNTASTTTLSHAGNVSHRVTLSGDDYFVSTSGGNDAVKPYSDLRYSIDGGGFTPFPAGEATLATVAAGSYPNAFTVGYQVDVGAMDPPDTYTYSFTYSVIAN